MWSSIKIAALALGLAALSSNSVDAQNQVTTTTTTVTCEVGGLKVSNNFRYVTGRKNVEGSIYATCTDSKPQCFVDTRVRDAATAESISCDDNVIHESRRRLGVYMSGADHYWPQGIACYGYGTAFTGAQQSVFASAMNEYHTKTSVRFVTLDECKSMYPTACGGCTQSFQIVSNSGANDCFATLGYAPGARMDLNFGSGCFNGDGGFRVAVHELGHVLGLIHEHTHPSRQVVVLRSDLTLSPDNYMKEKSGATTAYDTGSVMHYSRETGICIPKSSNTIYCDIDQSESDGCVVPTSDMCDNSQDVAFGRATTLAPSDIATIAKIYGSGGQIAPTPAPVTAAPTIPVTVAPTSAPVTATPTTAPVTAAPTAAPVAVTPMPSAPTSAPVPVPPATQAPATQAPYTPVMTPVVTPATSVPTPVATVTPTAAPVATPASPVPAPVATATPVATSPVDTIVQSAAPVDTIVPTAAPVDTIVPTATPVDTIVPTATPMATPASSVPAPVATATPTTAPVATETPTTAPVDTAAPTAAPVTTAAPTPVAEPTQDPAQTAANSWDNMNQQSKLASDYPVDPVNENKVLDDADELDDGNAEVRGAAIILPSPTVDSPVQVMPPVGELPAPVIAASTGSTSTGPNGPKPTICDY